MKKHWQYLKYVIRHKWYVFRECLKLGVSPLIAVFHDWDKFLPDEWLPYTNFFYGNFPTQRDVNRAHMLGIGGYNPYTKEQCKEDFAIAWMKHQHRNKHHWQYWCRVDGVPLYLTKVLIWDKGNAQVYMEHEAGYGVFWHNWIDVDGSKITCDPMPDIYRREMLADWRGAGRAITGKDNTLDWYIDNYWNIKLHDETRMWVEGQLLGYEVPFPMHVEAMSNNCSVEMLRNSWHELAAKYQKQG